MTASFFNLNATFAVELAVFAIVLAVVARFVVRPLQAAMRHRQAEIDDSLAKASRVEELLAAAEADYEATLDQARKEARQIIATAQRMADGSRQRSGALVAGAPGHLQQPNITAMAIVPNGELSSIDLLDAAHSAGRALIALQNNLVPDESRPVSADDPGSSSPRPRAVRQLSSAAHRGPMTLADVSASGAQ